MSVCPVLTQTFQYLDVQTLFWYTAVSWEYLSQLSVSRSCQGHTVHDTGLHSVGFPRLLRGPGFFRKNFQDMESAGNLSQMSWKVLKFAGTRIQ